MGDHVSSEETMETRVIDGVSIDIVRLIWRSGGVSYDLYSNDGNAVELLTTGESFDLIPTDNEIRAVIHGEDSQHVEEYEPSEPCDYPNCLNGGPYFVNGKNLCGTHESEYRQFLRESS